MNFRDAQRKLLAYVRNQIRNGELTERGFARLIGISQPHAHNVLKGVRKLSPEALDMALKCLHLSILDLAGDDELAAHLQSRRLPARSLEVPFLDRPIGPGMPWPAAVSPSRKFCLPFTPGASSHLVMARLVFDPSMKSMLDPFDLALLDTTPNNPATWDPQGLFVIETSSAAVLRYIRPGSRACYLAASATLDHPHRWERLSVSFEQLTGSVKARVRWLGREFGSPEPQTGRFLYDPISS